MTIHVDMPKFGDFPKGLNRICSLISLSSQCSVNGERVIHHVACA